MKIAQTKSGHNHTGRKPGVPDGISHHDWPRIVRKARIRRIKIVKRMADLKIFEPDNDVAKKAIDMAVDMLSLPGEARLKLQAAKTLLEFTQRKPVSASEVTLNKAEALLDAIAENENIDAETIRGPEEA